MTTESDPGPTVRRSPPSPSDDVPAGAVAASGDAPGDAPVLVAAEAAALRIEHWRDGEHYSLIGLDALGHSVGESGARHWIDLVDPSPALVEVVSAKLGLHPLVAEDIVERNQRAKLELTGATAHLVVFAVAWERELLVDEIDIVLGSIFLLTVHTSQWDPWRSKHLRDGAGPLLARGTDYLLWALLDDVVDGYYPVFDRLEDAIDDLEDRIVSQPDSDTLDQLFALKRQLVELRHVSSPQREVFNQLTDRTLPFIAAENVLYFRDLYDHAVHLSDEYDAFRDRLSAALSAYLSTVNNGLSLIMKRLTGITVILAGTGAFAGIFGMSEAAAAFTPAAEPGFWLVTAGIIALAFGLYVVLRRLDWI